MNFEKDIVSYLDTLKRTIDRLDVKEIDNFINILLMARAENKNIFIMGNGGSASTASHFVCDFNKGISLNHSLKFKLICLNDNIPSLMAYANDIGYDSVFVEQMKNYFVPGDYVIGISGSGNSKNVVKAIEYANSNSGITLGLTGFDGGIVKKIAKHNLHIPIADMQITEDLHMVMDHLVMKLLSTIEL